jgi:hypothetical protein
VPARDQLLPFAGHWQRYRVSRAASNTVVGIKMAASARAVCPQTIDVLDGGDQLGVAVLILRFAHIGQPESEVEEIVLTDWRAAMPAQEHDAAVLVKDGAAV